MNSYDNDLKILFLTDFLESPFFLLLQVKTTSPKKYFVRPNTGVIQPWDSCFIRGAPLELAILFRHVCSYRLNI